MRLPGRKPKPPAGEEAPPAQAPTTADPTPAPEPIASSAEAATLDGLRAWVAQLDRKLGTRFYALGAATVLALAAGIVAIVLALGVKDDSATKSDLTKLRGEVAGVERSASQAAQDEVAALGDRVSQLESQIQGLRTDQTATEQQISVLEDDVADLRDDISAVESRGNGGNN